AGGRETRGRGGRGRRGTGADLPTRGVEIGAGGGDPLGPPPADVPAVGRARGHGGEPIPFTADPDRRMRPLHRRRIAEGSLDGVVLPLEDRPRLGPHATDDLDALVELRDALTDARKGHAIRAVLVFEPAGAET